MLNSNLINVLRRIRAAGTCWMTPRSLDHVEELRMDELATALKMLPPCGKLLEIGAGTGWQANALERAGYQVYAIDLPTSNYRESRVRAVTEYDGRTIPYPTSYFDVVFSSNVLEHIPHVREFQAEIQRVLKPGGVALHLLPSSSWRCWTNLTHVLRLWTPPNVHGEHAANAWSEILYFRRAWWASLFAQTGWIITRETGNELFYTGYAVLGQRLGLTLRRRMSRVLGSACTVFLMRKPDGRPSGTAG